ncbi:MAG: hypothetical protein AAF182_03935 [Pseudomonadota bacterium]
MATPPVTPVRKRARCEVSREALLRLLEESVEVRTVDGNVLRNRVDF